MDPRSPRPPRVVLFATCLADRFFADACADAVSVLRHFGVDVDVPAGQTCCGQPAYTTGHRAEATRMASYTVALFEEADHVVLPSGSCAGMIRAFYADLLRTPVAAALATRTWELSQFLVHVLGAGDGGPHRGTEGDAPLGTGLRGRRVAYHHACHALRELGVHDEPLALLRACGADVVPWDGGAECCGFGGLFATRFPEVSAGMADRKLDVLPDVDVVTSTDGGCLLQLGGRAGARAHASPPRIPPFVHLATLLREGLGA